MYGPRRTADKSSVDGRAGGGYPAVHGRGPLKRFRRAATRPAVLAGDLAAGGGYLAVLAALPSITGTAWVDGALGVLLGLAMGSHPATNFLDALIYWRIEGPPYRDRRVLAAWFGLNGLVLAAAGVVIAFGASRLAAP